MLRRAFVRKLSRYRKSTKATKICLPVADKSHFKSRTQESLEEWDWDRWIKYLGGKGITSNPFRRSQWETNSYGLMRALGLNQTGAKMKFNIADDIRTQLISPVTEYDQGEKMRASKDDVQVSVISSLPGGGKTRLLLELLSLLPDFDALYYVTFNNLSEFDEAYDVVHDWSRFKKSIAMRILFQAVQIQRVSQPELFFSSWLDEVRREQLKDIHNIRDAMKLLGGDPRKKCVLAVDEASRLADPGQKSTALPHLIRVLGEAMLGTRVFSYMAGTLLSTFADAATSSGYGINPISLRLLSYAQESAILDDNPSLAQTDWRCNAKAKELLSLLGGHPRLLEVFIKKLVEALANDHNLNNVNWTDVEVKVRNSHTAISFCPMLSIEDAKRLVDVIMLRQQVRAYWPLPSSTTYENLQRHSTISLQPVPGDPTYYYPTTPLLAFRDFVASAKQGSEVVYKDLYKLLDMRSDNWSKFERFVGIHTTVMNCLFANQPPDTLRLSQLYADGYGGAGDIAIKFITKYPRLITCPHHFPKRSSIRDHEGKELDFADGNCYINAPNAPFGDLFWVCDEDVENNETDADMIDDEGAMGNPKLVIAVSCKRYISSSLPYQRCIGEHEKNVESWNKARNIRGKDNYRVITILITTGQVSPSATHRNDKDLLVIDAKGLANVYGILLPLLNIELTKRYPINRADWTSLAAKFNETAARQIIDERKLGFKDKSDFLERLPKLEGVQASRLDRILNDSEF